jgi:NDP-sugar pyrophosphorylase family protein
VEAIILAGGKAERLGDAAAGRPKSLVEVAGKPLVAYQVEQLAAAGVDRILLSCAEGQEELFREALVQIGPQVVPVGEPEPLGRGGGIRFAAAQRRDEGAAYALNGDELVDVDLLRLLELHCESGAAATITVNRLRSAFGVVELDRDELVTAFREAPELPYWVNAGLYVLDDEAIGRLPERGDHEQTTFPDLAGERRLAAYRHDGFWITVNTPKDLRLAEEFYESHPELQPTPR